jgi:hypothetical protein
MNSRTTIWTLALIGMILLAGCAKSPLQEKTARGPSTRELYTHPSISLSFSYPTSFTPNTEGLPQRIAFVDIKQDAIMVLIGPGKATDNVTAAGIEQAMSDTGKTEIEVAKLLQMKKYGEREWYTYSLQQKDRGLESVVAGTACSEFSLTIVLVSQQPDFFMNSAQYEETLASVRC